MSWIQASLQLHDRAVHAILDARFSATAPVPELPCLNWIGLWMREAVPENSYVAETKHESFLALEREMIQLAAEISNGWAVYCIRLLSRGIAEYYFYTRDVDTLSRLLPLLKHQHPEYRIERECKTDPAWSEYKKYLKATS